MRPLGPNQRRLLEALVDGRLPVAGRMGWTETKIRDTLKSLEKRDLVYKTEIRDGDSVIFRYHLTSAGIAAARPNVVLGARSAVIKDHSSRVLDEAS